jgi:hypothetical protein
LNLALVGYPYWRDYAVDVEVHYARDDKDDYCGVVVLANDERNYFFLSLGRWPQRAEWWMKVNGELTMVPGTQVKSVLKEDRVYDVRVEVSDGKVVTYLDGKEITSFSTRIFNTGLAGLLSYSDGASPRHFCAFDWFRVSPLEP